MTQSLHHCVALAALALAATVPPAPLPAGTLTPGDSIGMRAARPRRLTGLASYYGGDFAGKTTASGERFDPRKPTAAHRSLHLGTLVRVTNLRNGRRAVVRINDRGPYISGRMLDLSQGAAQELGMLREGVAPVQLEVLSDG